MALLDDKVKESVRNFLSILKRDVKIIIFTKSEKDTVEQSNNNSQIDANINKQVRNNAEESNQMIKCPTCKDANMLMEEIIPLSDKISAEKYNFEIDKYKTEQFKVDKIPAFAIIGALDSSSTQWKNYGIKFYGIPAGYEFTSFLDAIKLVSNGNSDLSQKTKDALKKITKPINIKIFVTLTCPYCPNAVMLANRFAVENDFITSEMIESAEFPHLANKYNVYGVPKVIINENIQFEGALPEDLFVEKILSISG